jgi:hypothetical protein
MMKRNGKIIGKNLHWGALGIDGISIAHFDNERHLPKPAHTPTVYPAFRHF